MREEFLFSCHHDIKSNVFVLSQNHCDFDDQTVRGNELFVVTNSIVTETLKNRFLIPIVTIKRIAF